LLKLTKVETTKTEYVLSRALRPEEREERPVGEETPVEPGVPTPVSIVPETDVIKGIAPTDETRRLERDIRLYPRKELGKTKRMKFDIKDLYDLSKIPDDAAREFELYLQCIPSGDRATIAQFVHDKYMGK
jgi:hypothetical protein